MASKLLANRVKESSTSSGISNFTLDGAVVNYQSFNTAFGIGSDNKFYYWLVDSQNNLWESGIGYLSTSTILIRETVLDNSSNTQSAINFTGSSVKEVFCAPSEKSFVRNNYTATTNPTTTDDITIGYEVGSKWINVTLNKIFICVDSTDTTPVWRDIIYDGYSSGGSLTGTWTDLGTVTTIIINGGTIDGMTINTSNITVGATKTLDVSAGTLTLANDQISGNVIDGGLISNFASTGIDDNAVATVLTISSAGLITTSGGGSLTGTWSDLGTVTTVIINGGTINGTTIATSNITVGATKTLDVSAGTLTLANDQISGDKIHSGTISLFASTGIDDNAVSNAITINSSQKVLLIGDLEVAGATISANGNFATDGDAQSSRYVARVQTSSATSAEMFIDGTSLRLIIPASTAWNFTVKVISREAATQDTKAFKIEGLIKRDGANVTSIIDTTIDTVLAGDAGSAAWTTVVTADDINEALIITVTGEAAKTINWVANIDLVEVS